MPETNTTRSNCRFSFEKSSDGQLVLIVHVMHETIPALRNSVVGFDLLRGIRADQAKKLVDALNEYVLDVFVTVSDKGTVA
jgi:hypothetical protein